jgi:hypothetical protein
MENGYLHIFKHICKTNLRRGFLRKRKFSEGFLRQNQENYIMFKYFFIENCVVYPIMWKNVVDRDREHDYIIPHTTYALCTLLYKAMYTQSKYNLLLFHTNNIYTTVPSYRGCKKTVGFFCISLCK